MSNIEQPFGVNNHVPKPHDELMHDGFNSNELDPNLSNSDIRNSVIGNLIEDVATLKQEALEDGFRMKRISAFAIGASTQVLDRGRAMIFALPYAFDHSLLYAQQHHLNGYESAGVAGLAVGATFSTWSWVVGKSFHLSLNSFPKTTDTVIENHPVMVDVVSKAVGGFLDDTDLEHKNQTFGNYEVEPYEARNSRIGKVALGVSRGLKTTFLFGSTAYVGMSKTKGYSEESNKKLRRTVTVESGLTTGALAAVVSGAVTHNLLGLAQDIRDAVTNKPAFLSVTAGLVGYSAFSNWLSRRNSEKLKRLITLSQCFLIP